MNDIRERKIIGVIMTYNCANLLRKAYDDIPKDLFDEIICVDDASTDETVSVARQLGLHVMTHAHTGYGGNLLFGMREAVALGATGMIEIHGDGQFDYTAIPNVIDKLDEGCDFILGNRFYDMIQPLRDGMSLVRYFGNIVLSGLGRLIIRIPAADLFTGTRGYSRRLWQNIDFSHNTRDYFFSFQIVAQAHFCGLKFGQVMTRCNYRGEHTSMHILKGVIEIFQTIYTVSLFVLARCGYKRGIFSNLTPILESH